MSRIKPASGLLLPRFGLGEADKVKLIMVCDGDKECRDTPARAPCIVIPSRTPHELGHAPLLVWAPLHYCDRHATEDAFDVQHWLTPDNKMRATRQAQVIRPPSFRLDFDKASVRWILVTTHEYRDYMHKLGVKRAYTS